MKKFQKRISALLLAGCLLASGFTGARPRAASANAAYIPANNQFDISVSGDGADISVSNELLTFDMLQTNSCYNAQVSAEYTMDSPSEKTVSLGFPFVSTLAGVGEGVSIGMNGQALDFDVYILCNDDYYSDYDNEIRTGFADLTFDEQLQAAAPKNYRSEHESQSGWMYIIDDNFYGKISFSAGFVVSFGDFTDMGYKDNEKCMSLSGGGYLFSYGEPLNLSGIPAASYTSEECVAEDLFKRVFPAGYYSEVSFLYDKYYSRHKDEERLSLNLFLDSFLTGSRALMLVYDAPFLAGENKMTVGYKMSGSRNYNSSAVSFYYYTNPAKVWKSFGSLTVRIDTYRYISNCNLSLKRQKLEQTLYRDWDGSAYTRDYNRYEYTGGLPARNLRFTSSYGKNPDSINKAWLVYILTAVIVLLSAVIIVLGALAAVFIVKYKRAKTRAANPAPPRTE